RGDEMNAHLLQRMQLCPSNVGRDRRSLATAFSPGFRMPRMRASALAVAAALVGAAAFAQETGPVEEVTVTGSRIATSGVNTPTPVTAVTTDDLQSMAPGTFVEALKQLPQFYNTIT